VGFPDKKADEEKWPEIKQWIDWVDAQRNLGGDRPTNFGYVSSWKISEFVKNPQQPVGTMLHGLWMDCLTVPQRIRAEFLKQNQIIREYPWLKTQGATQ
jgi:hypothetical protein